MEKFQLPPEYDTEELRKLVELFPQFWKESYFDFEEMKSYVSGIVPDDLQEKYSFTWHGKTESYRLLKKNSNGTLRPCKEKSVNWDTTQNLYIEGDNLEVLKLIKHTYAGERGVKMIYIDPPYNSNEDFIYDDNFIDSLDKYLEYTNQKGIAMPEASGRYHTRWLNMMYPRLWLANYLLRDDGVIFISIDDREVANLRKLCDEVFGEENFIAQFNIASNSAKNNSRYVSVSHEYVVCYAKSKPQLGGEWQVARNNLNEFKKRANSLLNSGLTDDEIHKELLALVKFPRFYEFDHYTYTDKRGPFRASDLTAPNSKSFYDIMHPITNKPCKTGTRGWAYTQDSMQQLIDDERILWGSDENMIPQLKNYLYENETTRPKSNLFFDSQSSTKWIKSEGVPFDFSKSIDLIKYILSMSTKNNDLILDFFSGSATTAHAVMQLNAEDGGNRRFICVQLPEACNEKSEAYKAGYRNICEIGKERIRRAGKKILEEWQEKQSQIKIEEQAEQSPPDIGFRVFKLDKSNFRTWDDTPIERKEADKLIQQMELYANSPFVKGRSHEDIVYEVIRMNNYPLTTPILPIKINAENPNDKKIVYGIGEDYDFIICLDVPIGEKEAEELCKYRPGRILFTDSCFENTEIRVNVEHTIRNINAKIKLKVV